MLQPPFLYLPTSMYLTDLLEMCTIILLLVQVFCFLVFVFLHKAGFSGLSI